MEALIDNYTTTILRQVSTCQTANVSEMGAFVFGTTIYENNASIILSHHDSHALNSRIIQLIDEYSQLKNNWDEDDALAPEPDVIDQAKYLANVLEKHGQTIFHAAPGPNGEIMLDLRNKQKTRSMEIIFYPNRSVVVFFPDNGEPSQAQFDIRQLSSYLEWLNENSVIWKAVSL